MYIGSGTHWGVNTYTAMRAIQYGDIGPVEAVYKWSTVTTAAIFVNVGSSSKPGKHMSLTRRSSGSATWWLCGALASFGSGLYMQKFPSLSLSLCRLVFPVFYLDKQTDP